MSRQFAHEPIYRTHGHEQSARTGNPEHWQAHHASFGNNFQPRSLNHRSRFGRRIHLLERLIIATHPKWCGEPEQPVLQPWATAEQRRNMAQMIPGPVSPAIANRYKQQASFSQ